MPLRRLAHLTLLVLALLTGLAGYYASQLRFNYNFNDFYPAGDPDLGGGQGGHEPAAAPRRDAEAAGEGPR